jgi:nickel superoxide dismutase
MKLFKIKSVYAHCDLPCGVYDPAQARIEAQSVKAIMEKYDGLDDYNKTRAIIIKEQRAEMVKNYLMILWADYFKPNHLETYPEIHDLFWRTIKQASVCKAHQDVAEANKLLEMIDQISEIFQKTKQA